MAKRLAVFDAGNVVGSEDSTFVLEAGTNKEHRVVNFHVGAGVATGARMVLTYELQVVDGSEVWLAIRKGSNKLVAPRKYYSSDVLRTLQELIDPGVLKEGDHPIEF